MTQSSLEPHAAVRAWPSIVIPSILLLVAAVVSVALACKGSAWALETVASHGLGCLTGLALLSAVALSIWAAEGLIPPIVPLPGIRLGLANILLLLTLYLYGRRETFLVLTVRLVLGDRQTELLENLKGVYQNG